MLSLAYFYKLFLFVFILAIGSLLAFFIMKIFKVVFTDQLSALEKIRIVPTIICYGSMLGFLFGLHINTPLTLKTSFLNNIFYGLASFGITFQILIYKYLWYKKVSIFNAIVLTSLGVLIGLAISFVLS